VNPFNTTLKLDGTFGFTQNPDVSASSNNVDIVKNSGEFTYNTIISETGLYYVTAEAQRDGNSYTDTIALLVNNQSTLDAMMQAKWDGMKTALVNGDIQGALNYYQESSKEKYQKIFEALTDQLHGVASAMRDIELVYINEKVAKYRIKKQEILQGQIYDITYFIYFVKGYDGLWKVESF